MKISKEAKIGIIITIIIAVFIWGINFLKGKNILVKNSNYYAVFDEIAGLKETSPVYLGGYKIGLVESIEFHKTKRGKLVVEFSLENDISIPLNSKIILYSSDIMSTKALKIALSDTSVFYNNNDTIPAEVEEGIQAMIEKQIIPIKEKTEKLIESMDSVISMLDFNTRTEIKNTISHLNHASNEIDALISTEKEKLTKIFSNIESISSNLEKNNAQITAILSNLSSVSDSISKSNITSIINNANLSLIEFQAITHKINSGEGTIGLLLNNDSLYKHIDNSANNLDKLIIDLNKNPQKYVHFSVFGKKEK